MHYCTLWGIRSSFSRFPADIVYLAVVNGCIHRGNSGPESAPWHRDLYGLNYLGATREGRGREGK